MTTNDQLILRYYLNQAGSGYNNRDFVLYRGAQFQKGSGLFSALGGLFRSLLPVFKSGAKAVGKEALKMGSNVLTDIATTSTPPKQIFKNRLKEAGSNLKRKATTKLDTMMGSGKKRIKIKGRSHRKKKQSKSKRGRRCTSKTDIFSI